MSELDDAISESPPGRDEEVARLKRALSRKVRNEEAILLAVKDALRGIEIPTPPPYRPRKPTSDTLEAAILHISDTQIGKVTRSYDIATARDRVLLAGEKALKIAEIRRSAARVEECHLFINGDVVEGEMIYPGQTWDIECGAAEQATRHAPRILFELVSLLAQGFARVHVTCVPGNHGRVGLPSAGGSPRTNWDRVAFDTLELLLEALIAAGRVSYQVAEDWYVVVPILGRGHLVTHGNQGVGGGSDFALKRAADSWGGSMEEEFTYLHVGHFHNARMLTCNKRVAFINGSTESHNDYALSKMNAASDPVQLLFFATEEHGIISINPLWLR